MKKIVLTLLLIVSLFSCHTTSPKQVEGVEIYQVGDSIYTSWTPVYNDEIEYQVEYSLNGNDFVLVTENINPEETLLLSSITEFTSVDVKVLAYNQLGQGEYGEKTYLYSETNFGEFEITYNEDSNSLDIVFTHLSKGETVSYIIYDSSADTDDLIGSQVVEDDSVSIEGIDISTMADGVLKIICSKSINDEIVYNLGEEMILVDAQSPEATLEVVETSDNVFNVIESQSISAQIVGGEVNAFYTLTIEGNIDTENNTKIITGTQSSVDCFIEGIDLSDFDSLTSEVTFTLDLIDQNQNIMAESAIDSITTDFHVPTSILNVIANSDFQRNQVVLTWDVNSDSDFSEYLVCYGTNSSANVVFQGDIDNTGTIIDGLDDFVSYKFTVQAVNTIGNISVVENKSLIYKCCVDYLEGDIGPAGGIIAFADVYNQYDDINYIEVAPSNFELVGAPYTLSDSNILDGIQYSDSYVVGQGVRNLEIIVSSYSSLEIPTDSNIASYYTYNLETASYSDWILPTVEDLELIYDFNIANENILELNASYEYLTSNMPSSDDYPLGDHILAYSNLDTGAAGGTDYDTKQVVLARADENTNSACRPCRYFE